MATDPPHTGFTFPPGLAGDPMVGTILADRYKILRRLGEGGMGTVYEAEHIVIEKRLAVKVLAEDFAKKTDLVQRFMQEARAASRIGHENIVDVTDFGQTPSGSVFIVMELLAGRDLAHHIHEGAMAWARARPILTQICRALGAAHAKGIIHRDLKPENIFLIERGDTSDFVKVLDFGIAKISSTEMGGESARLTKTGMIFGTPEYMSPEQAQGTKPDHRVDVYSVGVIMYEMMTGTVPFKADTFMGVLTKHMFEPPKPPSEARPDLYVPADVEAVILKSLEKDRDRRFQSMQDFEAAIGGCAGTGRLSIPPPHPATHAPLHTDVGRAATVMEGEALVPRRTRAVAFVGVAGGVAAVAILALLLLGGKKEPPSPSAPTPAAQPASLVPPTPTPAPAPAVAPSAQPSMVDVTFKSQPAGGKILHGEVVKGRTPATLRLPYGTGTVAFTVRLKGYRDATVEVVPDRSREYAVGLDRARSGGSHRQRAADEPPKPAPAPVAAEPSSPPAATQPPSKLKELKNPFGN